MMCHWANVYAIEMCVYYMLMWIWYMYRYIYVHAYVMFTTLHPPCYNIAKMHLLSLCSVLHDDLCLLLFVLVSLLSQICCYVC